MSGEDDGGAIDVESLLQLIRTYRTAFPDTRLTIKDLQRFQTGPNLPLENGDEQQPNKQSSA